MGFFGGGGASAGIGGSTGATDNAILRADGTGGATLQNSNIIIEDQVIPFSCTGDASTDIITASGHNFTTNQGVRFQSLSGGSGLNTTTNYFVRDISGDTFKISTSAGGAAFNFTTNITAGSIIAIQQNISLRNNSTETNSAFVITPKGTGAFIVGGRPDGAASGGTVRGNYAIDMCPGRTDPIQCAIGSRSAVVGGVGYAAGADSATLGGLSTQAIGDRSIALGGDTNIANGTQSLALGAALNTASGVDSIAMGAGTLADRQNLWAFGCFRFSSLGDSQKIFFVLRGKTTTNSAVELTSPTRLSVPSGKIMSMFLNITGTKSDGSAVAHYLRQYSIKNVAGTTSEVYAPVTIGTDNAAGTSIAIDANDTNDALRIQCTGVASETWRWVASVDAVEVAYGT